MDTRADLDSIYTSVVYGDAIYDPANSELPANDDILEDAGTEVYFSTFDDASGTTEPDNPCDQTLETVSGADVYRIEKSDSDGVTQEGVLFLTLPAQASSRPMGLKAQVNLVNVNTDSFAYIDFAGFTGVLMGLVDWRENTGVFLFFVDDGTKRVVVAGPAEDGTGTRSTAVTTVFDWSAEAYTYSVHWDPSVHARKAMVFATDSAGDETLLAELDIDTLPEFLTSVRMGELYVEDQPTDSVTYILGADFPDMGDYIDVYGLDLYDFGRVLLVGGSPTGSSVREVEPTEVVFLDGPDGPEEWVNQNSGTEEQTSGATVITTTTGGDYYLRDEPDLSDGEWMVIGKIAGSDSEHLGVYTTGMGVVVEDGTRAFRLTFLDDFTRNLVGVEEADATDDSTVVGYKVPSDDVEWETAFDFVMLGSTSRDILRAYFDSDTEVGIVHTYTATGYPASTESRISFGFFDETTTFEGSFYLAHLWLFPNCTFYEPVDGGYPEGEGWTRTAATGSRAITDDELEVDCTGGGYDIYSITDSTYVETAGAAVLLRLLLDSWTDSDGASSPLRTEIGPIAAIRTTTGAVQIFLTKNSDGKVYIYFSQQASDLSDVLSQNEAGRAISYEIDISDAHTYLLDVKPFQYVRLYLDYNTDPIIDVDWADSGTAVRALPANMPSDAVIAVGSLGEDAGVKGTFAFFRGSIGRGYDLKVTLDVSEEDLQASIYGAAADLLIDLQDED